MKTLIVVFLLLLSLTIKAWITIEHPNYDRENQSYCYGIKFNVGELLIGESKQLTNICGIATCRQDRLILYRGCNPIAARYPCFITEEDNSKPFPECCRQIKCVED